MFNWLKRLFARKKATDDVQDAINSLYASNNQNRTPLDPDNNPWKS